MNNSPVVIDANIAIRALIPTEQTKIAFAVLERLREEKASLYTPHLWFYEVTAGIHKYLHAKVIEQDVAEEAIADAFELNVRMIDETSELCKAASRWATRLQQMVAYDGFYLAVAEQLDAPFWTADKRLANNARQLGVKWVRWIGDVE